MMFLQHLPRPVPPAMAIVSEGSLCCRQQPAPRRTASPALRRPGSPSSPTAPTPPTPSITTTSASSSPPTPPRSGPPSPPHIPGTASWPTVTGNNVADQRAPTTRRCLTIDPILTGSGALHVHHHPHPAPGTLRPLRSTPQRQRLQLSYLQPFPPTTARDPDTAYLFSPALHHPRRHLGPLPKSTPPTAHVNNPTTTVNPDGLQDDQDHQPQSSPRAAS